MYQTSIDGKKLKDCVGMICDSCGTEYKGRIETSMRQFELNSVHECRICVSRRAGKKTAIKMKEVLRTKFLGEGNPMKSLESRKKLSESHMGKPLSEEHKKSLRKPKSKCDEIKKAANRPEEVKRRSDRMILNNPSKRPEVREKISKTVCELYKNGTYDLKKKNYKTAWVQISKSMGSIWCRSGLEQNFLFKINLVDNVSLVASAAYLRIPYTFNNSSHNYLPDFRVVMKDGSQFLVEIKSSYFLTLPKEIVKMEALKNYCKNKPLTCVILNEKEIDSWLEQLRR